MKIISLSAVLIMIISGLAVANVPAPQPAKSFVVELLNEYEGEYDFYYCKRLVVDENKGNKSKQQFLIEKVELTKSKPLKLSRTIESESLYQIRLEEYLVAIRKDIALKIGQNTKLKINEIIENGKDDVGFYFARFPVGYRSCSNNSPCYEEFKLSVERLDEKGLKFQNYQKDGVMETVDKVITEPKPENSRTCVGSILFMTGLVMLGVFGIRKQTKL